MTSEQQVCSLDLAKRLKELGVKQESSFHWLFGDQGWQLDMMMDGEPYFSDEGDKEYSAFSVAELGEMLPPYFFTLKTSKRMYETIAQGQKHYQSAATEADARAKMLVYLLENNLL